MPRVRRQAWLVVAAMVLMMAAAVYAVQPTVHQAVGSITSPTAPRLVSVGVRAMAGWSALVISGLLLLVFLYRRRLFILLSTVGWAVTALSMFVASREYAPEALAWLAYGLSQFLGIVAALLFVLSADAHRKHPRIRRDYALILVPMILWFTLAPMILQATPVFVPGHLMISAALAAAGVGHLLLLRHVRMTGAAVAGAGLLLLSVANLWTAVTLVSPGADGAAKSLMVTVVLYLITAGGMQLMTFEDMTHEIRRANRRLEHAQARLRRMVITDPLTGCHNRRFFEKIIGRELERHHRYGEPLSLLFVDIDRFKAINDTYGHDVGDEALRQVAKFLLANIREADYVFRWGGDEFLVLLSCTEAEARRRGESLEAGFTRFTDAGTMPAEVRLSIGCAEVRDSSADVMSTVRVADGRMYENKRQAAS